MNTSKSQKVVDAESHIINTINNSKGRKVIDVEFYIKIAIKKTCISQIIKPFTKAKNVINIRKSSL